LQPVRVPAADAPANAADSLLPQVLSATPNPFSLLTALRRRWLLALSLGLLTATAAAGVMGYLSQPLWRARTQLHIAANRPYLIFDTPEGKTEFGNYQRAQLAMVKSRLVLNSALQDPKVAKLSILQEQLDPVDWLQNQ